MNPRTTEQDDRVGADSMDIFSANSNEGAIDGRVELDIDDIDAEPCKGGIIEYVVGPRRTVIYSDCSRRL
jgi:hypothetical protein